VSVAKQVDFAVGTVVSDQFLDRIQELHAAAAWNAVLRISGSSVQLQGTTGPGLVAVVIEGHIRFMQSVVSASFTSAASGTYGIWATTGASDSDPTFALERVAGTGTPAGVTYARKLGTVAWDGSALSSLTQTSGWPSHAHLHADGAGDALPANAISPTMIQNASYVQAVWHGEVFG
jgi:hypothetical protein